MKLSPYYKGKIDALNAFDLLLTFIVVFEEDASAWEDRLNRIHVLFGE